MFRFTQRHNSCRTRTQSCFHFAVSVITLATLTLAAPIAGAAAQHGPEHILREWAKASQAITPVGKAAQQRTFHNYKEVHKAHQIALINEFRGPVDADQLLKRYRFTATQRTGDLYRLSAAPRDDVEGLFVAGFTVTFSDDSYLPISLQFVGSDGDQHGDQIPLLSNRPQNVTAVFDRTAVDRARSAIRVAASTENPVGRKVQQADVEFPVKQRVNSKRLQEVLNRWKANAIRARTVRTNFRRFEYDHDLQTETRSQGSFVFQSPDKARFDLLPNSSFGGRTSGKSDKNGEPYHLRTQTEPETRIWWTNHYCLVSHDKKQIEVFESSPVRKTDGSESSIDRHVDSLQNILPVFGAWSPRMETDVEWTLDQIAPSHLHLKGVPRSPRMRRVFREIVVMLDSQTYRVRAVKVVNLGGRSESVYSLHDTMVNVDEHSVEFVDQPRFQAPQLPAYRTIQHGP